MSRIGGHGIQFKGRLLKSHFFRVLALQSQVEHLHKDAEPHREVNVAFGNVLANPFRDQRDTDQKQEAERQIEQEDE